MIARAAAGIPDEAPLARPYGIGDRALSPRTPAEIPGEVRVEAHRIAEALHSSHSTKRKRLF
jgi:hypothetical protein